MHSVVVYRLITCGTIEEKIYRKQVFKSSLFQNVVNSKDVGTVQRYFSRKELREVFKLDDPHRSETQLQLHAQNASLRVTYPELDMHVEWLESLVGIFGLSDHDLIFASREQISDVSAVQIEKELQIVKEKIANAESKPSAGAIMPPTTAKKKKNPAANKQVDTAIKVSASFIRNENIVEDSPLVIKTSVRNKKVIYSSDEELPMQVKKPSIESPSLDQAIAGIRMIALSPQNKPLDTKDVHQNLGQNRFSICPGAPGFPLNLDPPIAVSTNHDHIFAEDFEPGQSSILQINNSTSCKYHNEQIEARFDGMFGCSRCSCYLSQQEKIDYDELRSLALYVYFIL